MAKAIAHAQPLDDSSQGNHRRIIGALKKPWWMLNASPMDNKWIIRTHGGKKRNGDVSVSFDVPIAPGIRSVDLEDDLITAKLLAFCGLSGNDARYGSGTTTPINIRNYFAFLRWRYAHGIERNADLTPDDIDDLVRDLGDRGIVGLPPYEERFQKLYEKISSGEFMVPFTRKGSKLVARKNAITDALGAPHTRGLPPSINLKIAALIAECGLCEHGEPKDPDVRSDAHCELSENRIISFLTVVQLLYYYRQQLKHDAVFFEPFENENGIALVAKSIAKVEAQRTFTTPTFQACFLIDKAITWVTRYADEIKTFTEDLIKSIGRFEAQGHWRPSEAAFKERLRLDNRKYNADPGGWWPVHPSYFASPGWVSNVATDRPSLRPVLFELLATAAIVVIASFSARRKEEMGSLRDDCITEVDGEFWLETWISKNVRDLTKIPVPATVKRAIDVLLWLSKDGRITSGEHWLLDFAEAIPTGVGAKARKPAYDFYSGLARFAEFVNVPLIGEDRWIPKPTEYRRFFGMTYFHRFDFPNLVALSEFYRHYNPTRTRGYITETVHGITVRRREESAERIARGDRRIERFAADRLADFEKEGLEYRVSIIRDAVTGAGYMTGFGGVTIINDINKQISDYKAQISIEPSAELSEASLNTILRTAAEHISIDHHPDGHSSCKCTGSVQDLSTAKCVQAAAKARPGAPPPGRPDIEFATDGVCSSCVHNVQLPCHRQKWEDIFENEGHQAEHALLPCLRELARGRLDMSKRVLNRCHGACSGSANGT